MTQASQRHPRDSARMMVQFDPLPAVASNIQADSDNEELLAPVKELTLTEKVAERRSHEQAKRADAIDQKLLSTYLPTTIDNFHPNTIPEPNNSLLPRPGSCKQLKR
jgi:hypothetical protein